MRRGVPHGCASLFFSHNIATSSSSFLFLFLIFFISKRQVILATCISFFFFFFFFMYKGWKPSSRFCVTSHRYILNLDNIIVSQENPSLSSLHVPRTRSHFLTLWHITFMLSPFNSLSYSGQPFSFLFKTLHRNISLRSGSRTTLFVFCNHDDGYHDAWPSSKDDENALRAKKSTVLSPFENQSDSWTVSSSDESFRDIKIVGLLPW